VEISGKRVLITGASRGLGRTLAFAFGAAGTQEVLAGTRMEDDGRISVLRKNTDL
jgi:NAD(P)-dependent dehydrogenase (short-subunit alcohol dehydrogenase family)